MIGYGSIGRIKMSLFLLCFMGSGWVLMAQDFDLSDLVEEETADLQSEFIEARMYMMTEQYGQAAERLEELLIEDSNNPVFLYELARTYNFLGEKERALDVIERAHLYDPTNEWILHTLANLASDLNRSELAEEAYANLLNQFPSRSNYAISRAYHLLLLGQRSDALNVLDEIEEKIGVTPEISVKKISIYRGDNNYEKVDGEYRKLMEKRPNETELRMEYASFLEYTGNTEAAASIYSDILELNPHHAQARLALTEIEGGEMEADERLLSMLPVMSNPAIDADEKIKSVIPFLMEHSENYRVEIAEGLRKISTKLVEAHPDRAEIHAIAGDIAFSSFQFVQAAHHYAEALKIRTNVVQVWYNYMESVLRIRDFGKLKPLISEAMEFYPNQALFHYYKSRAHLGLGDVEEAEFHLSRAELMGRRQAGIQTYLIVGNALLNFEKGNHGEAVERINEGLSEFGSDPELLLMKSYLLLKTEGDSDEIKATLNRLGERRAYDPWYILMSSEAAVKRGNEEMAVEYLQRLRDYDTYETSYILERVYELYLQLDPEKAREIKDKIESHRP